MLRQAGEAGYVKASATLAIAYLGGYSDIPQNPKEGLRLAHVALSAGEPRGLTALAIAYMAKLVAGKSPEDGEALLRQAAERGDHLARETS